ncbi:unnamed protein product [Adineta steineri]|uniref:G-protein coupled receptors family 1 profile domain-containing protein n=1 Tax=Adineta steineri TaxID=433720 RepID=A0A819GX57_9BILA|nr:unnamed protein product [Adineta steineri]CAF3886502.1 unnamed protein product [Adineta steineri]
MSNSTVSINFNLISTILSAFADGIAIVICLTFLFIILYHLIQIKYNQYQVPIDVTLILSTNILCVIIIKITVQTIHVTIPTVIQDFQINIKFKKTRFCQIRAYIFYSMVGILYWSYVLLALFRFVRIIYPKQIWFHRSSFYLYILIPAQYIFVFILTLPLLIMFDGLHYISDEPYCSIVLTPIYPIIYGMIIIFVLPYSAMCILYLCIARKMQQMPIVGQYLRRNRRDYIVIRRMLLNIFILCIVSIPVFIIYIIESIYNRSDSLIYRVQWLLSSLSSCLFSLMLPLITVRLHDLLK